MELCFKCHKSLEVPFEKHGLHKTCFMEWFNLADIEDDFKSLTLEKEEISDADGNSVPVNSFFHGTFEKYSTILAKKQYILKISRDYPELAKTEYLCNQLGESIGLEVPPHFLIKFMGQDSFITYNFMQNYSSADLKHIYHFLNSEDKYTVETLVKIIGDNTGRLFEIKKFLKLCLFDALIGNHDRHGRNLSLIFTQTGCVFSPCYDNPSTLALEHEDWLGADFNYPGSIQTLISQKPTMKDYVEDIIRLGYKGVCTEFLDTIDLLQLESLIKASFISEKRKKAFLTFIHKAYRELKSVLQS